MESKVRASFRGCVSFSRESFCFRSKYFHGSAVYYPSWLKYLIQHFIIVIERNDKATYGCESIDNTLLRVRTVENHFSIRVTVRTINYSFSLWLLRMRRVLTRKSVFSTITSIVREYTLNIFASKFIPVERKKNSIFRRTLSKCRIRNLNWGKQYGGWGWGAMCKWMMIKQRPRKRAKVKYKKRRTTNASTLNRV